MEKGLMFLIQKKPTVYSISFLIRKLNFFAITELGHYFNVLNFYVLSLEGKGGNYYSGEKAVQGNTTKKFEAKIILKLILGFIFIV